MDFEVLFKHHGSWNFDNGECAKFESLKLEVTYYLIFGSVVSHDADKRSGDASVLNTSAGVTRRCKHGWAES